MSRFANPADKPKARPGRDSQALEASTDQKAASPSTTARNTRPTPNSRVGRKAIAAYFTPEMSLAMHVCARKNGVSLQELMTEAFDDVLRKYGESPIGA